MTPERMKMLKGVVRSALPSLRRNQRPDYLLARAELKKIIEARDTDMLCLEVWSRDCDYYETTRMVKIKPTVMSYITFEKRKLEDAEGPVGIHIMTKAEVRNFREHNFDRAAYQMGY